MDKFNDYLDEYRSIGVGPMIYDLIYKVVTEVVQHYPPSTYSSNNMWDDDAISGICNDFIINKLLNKGWLDSYFLSLDSIQGLKKVLKRDCRHYLISQKTRTEKNNLYMRVRKILQDNPSKFQLFSKADTNGSIWGLAGWTSKDVAQDIHFIVTTIATIQLPRLIRYRPDSAKLSPLISNPDLISLIENIFIVIDKQVSLDILFDAICNRLGVLTEETISLDDPIGEMNDQVLSDVISDPKMHVEVTISSKQIAEDIYEQLSDRQREILRLQFSSEAPNLVEISEDLGMSKSTVSNELTSIEQIISDCKIDSPEIDPVLIFLKELLEKNRNAHRFS